MGREIAQSNLQMGRRERAWFLANFLSGLLIRNSSVEQSTCGWRGENGREVEGCHLNSESLANRLSETKRKLEMFALSRCLPKAFPFATRLGRASTS